VKGTGLLEKVGELLHETVLLFNVAKNIEVVVCRGVDIRDRSVPAALGITKHPIGTGCGQGDGIHINIFLDSRVATPVANGTRGRT
jgi:hypothetical protein